MHFGCIGTPLFSDVADIVRAIRTIVGQTKCRSVIMLCVVAKLATSSAISSVFVPVLVEYCSICRCFVCLACSLTPRHIFGDRKP